MKIKLISVLLSLFTFSTSAFALLPTPMLMAGTDTYRIGDEWGKQPISDEDMAALPALERTAHATASVGGATGFLLGKFNNQWILATNYHVCPRERSCLGDWVDFTKGSFRLRVSKFLKSWTAIDLSLLVLEVDSGSSEEKYLEKYGRNFAFNGSWTPGMELVTVGFGAAGNPWREMVGTWDSDCKVFSQTEDVRFLPDPDQLNPGPYSTWSIAVGCDVSHGDSGSSMVNRTTGEVIGIVWTGKMPKSKRVQDSQYLTQMLNSNSPEIWQELNFVVPASAMLNVIRESVNKDNLDPNARSTLEQLIQ